MEPGITACSESYICSVFFERCYKHLRVATFGCEARRVHLHDTVFNLPIINFLLSAKSDAVEH